MSKTLYFEISEYQERLSRTQASMAQQGMDVLIVTDPANMNYLSGFDGWSFYVHQCLIVFADQNRIMWVGRGQDGNAARLTSWLEADDIRAYTDDYVQSLVKHPMDFVSDILKEKGYDAKVIGTEMDTYYFTAKCQERLMLHCPNGKFVDATNLVNWVKIIKSDHEIAYMRKAAKIAERVMQTAYEAVDIGVRQCDAAAKVSAAQVYGTEDFGGDYPSIIPLMPSGIRTSTPHLSWTDEPYQDGDTVILELSGCYRRYHCPLARTMILGKAPQTVIDLGKVVVEGINEALSVIKPGIYAEDVERAWARSIAKSGFIKDSRIGYSMGLNYPPDWGEHTASLRPGDKTVLQPNMTFHMIPGIWLSEYGVDISESFRVTETGVETFTNYPRQLLVK